VLAIAAVAGIGQTLNNASAKALGDHLDTVTIFVVALILGPLGGLLSLYVGGALLRWTGRWIGGGASQGEIRAALAWSSVPFVWSMLLWIPELLLFGGELFTTATPRMDGDPTLALALLGFFVIELVIIVWTLVVYLKCLGQVQGFSAWRALGNSMLAGLVVVVPIALLVGGVAMLMI
jgi:hypothetical protein